MMCGCVRCNQVRFLAGIVLLVMEAPDANVRRCAARLLEQWAKIAGASDLTGGPTHLDEDALVVCSDWVAEHPQQLRDLDREVAVSGYIEAEG